jgi:hypothetical protein
MLLSLQSDTCRLLDEAQERHPELVTSLGPCSCHLVGGWQVRSYPLYYFASASIAFANVESGLLLQ